MAWSAADLFYFAAGFTWLWLGLSSPGTAQQWFVEYGLLPATALREGMLLVVVGWCLLQMQKSTRDLAQDDRELGRSPPGGPTTPYR